MNIIMEGLVEKFQSARGFPDNEVSPSGPDTGSDHGQISVRSRSIGLLLMKIYEDFYKKVKKRLWKTGMNLSVHTQTMKSCYIRCTPASEPLRGTAGMEFF